MSENSHFTKYVILLVLRLQITRLVSTLENTSIVTHQILAQVIDYPRNYGVVAKVYNLKFKNWGYF